MAYLTHYSEDFRAGAILLLKAAGYPDEYGALAKVARNLDVPRSTLQEWWNGTAPVPPQVMEMQRENLRAAIQMELTGIFENMQTKRESATYRELAIAAGILIDKLQLLEGGPTDSVQQTITFVREGPSSLHKPTLQLEARPAIEDRGGTGEV